MTYPYNCLSESELLSNFYEKINQCVKGVNTVTEFVQKMNDEMLPQEVIKVVTNKINDGTLGNLINNKLLKDINVKVDTVQISVPYINVLTKGIINDGVTDISDALNNLIESNPNSVLYFPSGTYIANKTILINQDVSLIFDNKAILKANRAMDNLLIYNKSNFPTNDRFLKGVTLDGNMMANTVFNISGASYLYLDNISILNPINIGLDINSDGIPQGTTHNVNVRNINITNRNSINNLYKGIGISVRTSDCNFDNVSCVNMKKGLVITSGGNTFNRVHPWTSNIEIYKGSVGIRNEALSNMFNECYMDSVETGFSTDHETKINNFVFRTVDYILSGSTNSGTFIDNEGNVSVSATNCYFENAKDHTHNPNVKNSWNTKLIDCYYSKPFYSKDEVFDYTMKYEKTYRTNFTNIGVNGKNHSDKEIVIEGIKYNDVFNYCVIGAPLPDGCVLNTYLKDNKICIRVYNITDSYINIPNLNLYFTIRRNNENEILSYAQYVN